jgi:hypothetical protein
MPAIDRQSISGYSCLYDSSSRCVDSQRTCRLRTIASWSVREAKTGSRPDAESSAILRMHSRTCSTYARWDFTKGWLREEQTHGSEGSRTGEPPPAPAAPRVVRDRRPSFRETKASSHQSRQQECPDRFRVCLRPEPPSRKLEHCLRHGWQRRGGSRRDDVLSRQRCSFTLYCNPGLAGVSML